jgi:hypothetical protein
MKILLKFYDVFRNNLCTDGEEDGEDFLTLQDRERILETGRWVSCEYHRERKI